MDIASILINKLCSFVLCELLTYMYVPLNMYPTTDTNAIKSAILAAKLTGPSLRTPRMYENNISGTNGSRIRTANGGVWS